jgi:CIC family chloride channel protein
VRFLAGLLATSLAAALFALVFRGAIVGVLQLLTQTRDIVAAMHRQPWGLRLLIPALGGLAAGVCSWAVAKVPSGRGVGDVMEAVVLGRVNLSMRVTLFKSLGSWLAIVAGGSLGREGPLIQFGGAAGSFSGKWLRLPGDQIRILIAAGTAAGFAAAYNTPFAAILFVVEVVASVVVVDAMVPLLVATVLATVITRAVAGAGPIYGARAFTLQSNWELAAFAVLGILAAVAGQGLMRLLTLGERVFRRPGLPLPWRAGVGGLLAGALVVALPEVAGNGYEPLNAVLDGRYAAGFVALLLVAKALATTASVSSGSPGGVFTPTMLLGGGVGWLFGAALQGVFGAAVGAPGGYALVGMAATIAATIHAPLLAAVMAFELSGDYSVVLPLVLATAIATFVSRRLRRESIYTAELAERSVGWEQTLDGRRNAR